MVQNQRTHEETPSSDADRRQITALAYDLVGSTQIAHRLDAEDMRALLRQFHEACTQAVEQQGGRIHSYAGDGAMAFFGYPQAHENDVERGIRAGLDIVARCSALDDHIRAQFGSQAIRLGVRVGLATGPVVAGDFAGGREFDRNDIAGWPPHLAFRLQGDAEANSVVISAATRELVGELFDCQARPVVELRGFDQPQPSWQVLRERPYALRYQARRTADETPLMSREEELAIIRRRLQLANAGEGQVVLVTGEAGIGKSRLATAATEGLTESDHIQLRLQCSPQHANSALFPLITQLDYALETAPADWPQGQQHKLERLLSLAMPGAEAAAPLISQYLSLKSEPQSSDPALNTDLLRDRIQTFLLNLFETLGKRRLLLITAEDLQWIDPTSEELLDLIINLIPHLHVLLLLTARPEFKPRWIGRSHVTLLALNRLNRRQSVRIVEFVAGDTKLPDAVIDELIAKADGIPLFIEELTHTVMRSAAFRVAADAPAFPGRFPIPASLTDSLTARLDQLGRGKYIAQIGSAIGRHFPVALARSVANLDVGEAERALDKLVELGLVTIRGQGTNAVCTFKHALIQESAYQGMLKSTRQGIHRRISEALRDEFAGTRDAIPEVLAQHYVGAGMHAEAVSSLREAGHSAASRSENVEAARLFEQAVLMTRELPADRERDELELSLLVALGPLLITTRGPGTSEVQSAYQAAIDLCGRMTQTPAHFTAYWGWWRIASDAETLRTRADKLLSLAQSLGEPELLLQAHHCQWGTLFGFGEFEACMGQIGKGLEIYESSKHGYGALYGGHDPKVCALGEQAMCLWLLGYPDQSIRISIEARTLAEDLGHAGSTAQARDQELILLRFREDADTVLERAQAMFEFSEQQGFRDVAARSRIFRGWALCRRGEANSGIDEINAGLAAQRSIGTLEDFPFFCEMAGECYGQAGEPERGIELLDEAIAIAHRTGSCYWLPELLRRRGELLIQKDRTQATSALEWFNRAAGVARASGARMLALRAEVSAARVLVVHGRMDQAIDRVAPLCSEFTEGLDCPDLRSAKRILAALEGGASLEGTVAS